MISVIVPISLEDYKDGWMKNIRDQMPNLVANCGEEVELISVVNGPGFGRAQAKNFGAKKAQGNILVFMDCDLRVSQNLLKEVRDKSDNFYFAGGGVKWSWPSRWSLGILCYGIPLAIYMLSKQITMGAFWVPRVVFETIGGFRETKYDDIDFAIRLKKYAKSVGRKFESLKKSRLTWSTRKFDEYGDWHWLRGYHSE